MSIYLGMSYTHNTPLDQLLGQLELNRYYPSKLTINDVFRANTRRKEIGLGDIKWYILSKILSNDFTIRDAGLQELLTNVSRDVNIFHPQDVLITLLLCSSHLLRKTLINKLFMCKVAIPFIWATDGQLGQQHVSYDTPCTDTLGQKIKRTFFNSGKSAESRNYPQAQTLISSRKGGLGIKQTLKCYTWPLNFVSVDGRTSEEQPIDGFLSNQPFQVVSFIKFGKTDVSKSEVINHLITSEPHHSIFYTKNCALGDMHRSVSDGTIEASCHIPSEDFDCFGNLTLILNLRGDAKYYPNQIQLLKTISHVLVIFFNLTEIDPNKNEKGTQRLCDVCRDEQTCGPKKLQILFVFECPNNTEKNEKTKQRLYKIFKDKIISKEGIKAREIDISGQNGHNKGLHEISRDVKQSILNHFKLFQTDLTKVCNRMAEMGTNCDEMITNNHVKRANAVFGLLGVNCPPLQILWLEYSKTLKKMYLEKFLQNKKELKERTHQLLLQQYQSFAENPPQIICQMICELLDTEQNPDLMFFVHHLGNCFDKRSRQELPRALIKIQELVEARHKTNQKSYLDAEIEQANKDITFASFGIQTIIRDISHIFECVTVVNRVYGHLDNPTPMDKTLLRGIEKCPQIFAKLLAMGYLLELIDGDAFNIPTAWLHNVLECLKDEIGSKKRFLTLSILGLQSSGKSTLLNTMFGLQFAVSSGRCTKGVFMALVPVPSGEQYPFEYILVVDAEGLRSPEHEGTEYEHDNQLATFVVGVGDITLINVLGETTSEIREVLEIVVHAFLRFKQVQRNFQLNQSCVCVHQNVQGPTVGRKMAPGRNRFVESLNEITKEAAENEKVPNVLKFNDVIRFDSEKNVFCFPGLWCGSPPMSPVNPKYSDQVVKLKNFILDDIVNHRGTFFTVSDIAERIQNVWDGILSEDFVFTYRSGIELKASRKVEEQLFAIKRKLEFFAFEFLETNVYKALAKCEDGQALSQAKKTTTEELKDVLQQKIDLLIVDWNNFVKNDPLSDILKQWKQSKIKHIQKCGEDMLKLAQEEISQMVDIISADIRQNILLQPAEMSIWKTLADRFVEIFMATKIFGSINDRIERYFERKWTLPTERYSKHDIDASYIQEGIKTVLFDYFPADSVYLRKELDREFGSNLGHQISENRYHIESKYSSEQLNEITLIKKKILENIDQWLEKKPCERFSITEVKRILDDINENFTTENILFEEKNRLSLDTNIKAMLIVQAGKVLIVRLQDMHNKYEEQYGLKAKNEQYKKAVLNLFKTIVNTSMNMTDSMSIQIMIPLEIKLTEDKETAKIFASVIMKDVKSRVSTFLPQDVVNDVLADFSHTKHNLVIAILKDLAHKEVFEDYYSYINDTQLFVQQYLRSYIKNKMFSVEKKYAALVDKRISLLVTAIIESKEMDVETCQNSLLAWTKVFLDKIEDSGKFCLTENHFGDSRTRYVYSLKQFCEYLKRFIVEEKDVYMSTFTQETVEGGCDPYAEVFKRLWGCPETCPFCSEPCDKTDECHTIEDKSDPIFGVHSCVQHRPDGIRGWRYVITQILSIDVCSVNVHSDRKFNCNNDRFRHFLPLNTNKSVPIYHPYRKYKEYAPDWDIAPDCKLSSSCYWSWFICTFKQNIIKKYNVRWPNIPREWETISKNEAIASLSNTY